MGGAGSRGGEVGGTSQNRLMHRILMEVQEINLAKGKVSKRRAEQSRGEPSKGEQSRAEERSRKAEERR